MFLAKRCRRPSRNLGVFGNCEKRLLASSCLRFCPAACNSSDPTRRIFMKFHIWIFFENLSKRFEFYWNLTSISGTLHEDQYIILIISRSVLLRMRNVSDTFVEKIRIHILCLITSFRKSCHLWDNVEECGTAIQATNDNMAHAHCMLDAWGYKQTLRICDTYCFSTATMAAWLRLSAGLNVHCVSCWVYHAKNILLGMQAIKLGKSSGNNGARSEEVREKL
jgi:hypothetical protein